MNIVRGWSSIIFQRNIYVFQLQGWVLVYECVQKLIFCPEYCGGVRDGRYLLIRSAGTDGCFSGYVTDMEGHTGSAL
jgi:hypothetical protein